MRKQRRKNNMNGNVSLQLNGQVVNQIDMGLNGATVEWHLGSGGGGKLLKSGVTAQQGTTIGAFGPLDYLGSDVAEPGALCSAKVSCAGCETVITDFNINIGPNGGGGNPGYYTAR
jgi:hypothetical protein